MQLRSIQNFKYIRNRRIVLHQFSQHGELKLNILVIGSRMRIFLIFMRPNFKQSEWNIDKKTLSQCFQGNWDNSQTAVPLSRLSLMSCKSFQFSRYCRVVLTLAKSYWAMGTEKETKNKPWYILHKTSRTSGWTSCSSRWCSRCHCLGCGGASCNLQILLKMEAWDCWWHVPAKFIPFGFLSLDIGCHFIDCFLSVLLVNVLD